MRKILTFALLSALLALVATTTSEAQSKSGNKTAAASPAQGNRVTVKIVGFEFQPKEVTVDVGTTVEWINEGTRHSVDADDGSFKSPILKQGDKFEHTFTKAGSFGYFCRFHGAAGGKDMAGKVIVRKAKK